MNDSPPKADRWRRFREVPETFPGVVLPGPLRNQLLWDGDCGFCATTLARLRRFARKPFNARPYQEVQGDLPPEVLRWSTRQMHWVTAEGQVFGGSLALSAVLAASGHRLLAAALDSPILRPFSWLGYRLVADNRGQLAGVISSERETKCAVPEKPKPKT